MCTASWHATPEGYELWFNRDERIQRPEAQSPVIHREDKVKWIAPTDPAGGGTWLFANEFGLSCCLLNNYLVSTAGIPPPTESRGMLVKALAVSTGLEDLRNQLHRQLALKSYAPCDIIGLNPEGQVDRWSWDGRQCLEHGLQGPLAMSSSSSWAYEEVISDRRRVFNQYTKDGSPDLSGFHLNPTLAASNAHAVMMTRLETRTVSVTQVSCRQGEIEFVYFRRGPDLDLDQPQLTHLPLRK